MLTSLTDNKYLLQISNITQNRNDNKIETFLFLFTPI